ncbi:MAG: type III-B CRISPR module RAMP protein Cmr4 [Fimbriimonadaceae bacterium]|nr:type III-B CRISPR module RAMP protein Cmr4 [Fimbriimonadaceae bacterium]
METRPYLMHALSPLHVGTGHAADIIDLPIARQRATGLPYVPGSAIKGVLRDARRDEHDASTWQAVFGPETAAASDHAGALVAGDAVLLALPVRSYRGTFAWVTSPLLLQLAQRDGAQLPLWPAPGEEAAKVSGPGIISGNRLYLEDLDLQAATDPQVAKLAQFLAAKLWPKHPEILTSRLAVVHDEVLTFLMETATQLDTRVRLKTETRTVAKGALWIEESLPAETILLGLLAAEGSRRQDTPLTAAAVLDAALPKDGLVAQFGGKATIGRGRCRLVVL